MELPTEAVITAIGAMAGGMVAMHLRAESRGRACDRKYDALLRYVLAARDATIERNTTVMNAVLAAFGTATVDALLPPAPPPAVPQLGDEEPTDRLPRPRSGTGAKLGLLAAYMKHKEAQTHQADADVAWGKVEEHALARQPPQEDHA